MGSSVRYLLSGLVICLAFFVGAYLLSGRGAEEVTSVKSAKESTADKQTRKNKRKQRDNELGQVLDNTSQPVANASVVEKKNPADKNIVDTATDDSVEAIKEEPVQVVPKTRRKKNRALNRRNKKKGLQEAKNGLTPPSKEELTGPGGMEKLRAYQAAVLEAEKRNTPEAEEKSN